jgi:phage terminase large subunit-like protein
MADGADDPVALQVRAMKEEFAKLLAERQRRAKRNQLACYAPYPKQRDFHNAGLKYRERLFMAGNQLGKTFSGAAETAIHLTGRYPDWWRGRRFDHPVRCWAGGVTSETTRDTVQKLLVGPPEQEENFGTGAIPGDCIVDYTSARGVPNALDSVTVRHVSGGTSTLLFKSYERGREKWQGDTLHFIWMDEEPPPDIYTEALTRTNATGGMVFITFTPLLGMSQVVRRFISKDEANIDPLAAQRHTVIKMTIDDALHYSPEERAAIIASYPPHERKARAQGIPLMGKGQVFPVDEETITVKPFQIPRHWKHIIGIDFGWDHPFAAVHIAYDHDADVVYVVKTIRVREQTPVQHAAAIRSWVDCSWAPVSWPHDGLQHDKGSGESLAPQYAEQGLSMLGERATFPDGGNGLEAGVTMMLDRMRTGRLKVFSQNVEWFEEFRMYHRAPMKSDPSVVKIVARDDDLLSATRYAMMMLRFADTEPLDYDDYDYDDRRRSANSWTGY